MPATHDFESGQLEAASPNRQHSQMKKIHIGLQSPVHDPKVLTVKAHWKDFISNPVFELK
jgi:hypothetical protein